MPKDTSQSVRICPKCGGKVRVIKTVDHPGRTNRTRQCDSCEYVYKTKEIFDYAQSGRIAAYGNTAVQT